MAAKVFQRNIGIYGIGVGKFNKVNLKKCSSNMFSISSFDELLQAFRNK